MHGETEEQAQKARLDLFCDYPELVAMGWSPSISSGWDFQNLSQFPGRTADVPWLIAGHLARASG